MSILLKELHACCEGVFPSMIATADPHGEPNVTELSQVELIERDSA